MAWQHDVGTWDELAARTLCAAAPISKTMAKAAIMSHRALAHMPALLRACAHALSRAYASQNSSDAAAGKEAAQNVRGIQATNATRRAHALSK